MDQMNIFQALYKDFKFNKKEITLFESFAGVGSQAMAMKDLSKELGFTLKTIGISEIDKYAIQSYNAIHGETKNYGSICDIQEIPQVDIFTYSFPCQDISLAGKQKGFTKGSGTRSGLLWEVERLLENQYKVNKLPKVLLMENVKALAGVKFIDDFHEWRNKLVELGYSNYWKILNAKDYGIPQNRERVFMVSILGDYNYTFPKPFELKLRLKDMLENEVDEKYYLSAKQIKQISEWKSQQNPIENAAKEDTKYLQCITAKSNTSMNASMLLLKETLNAQVKTWNNESKVLKTKEEDMPRHRIYLDESVGFTVTTNESQQPYIAIKEATKKGYAEAQDGDGVYINRPHQKRGVVQKGMIQTLKTGQDVGVVENMRIRKLTPKECWRLMGFSDQDFNAAQKVCSNTQLYKQAGNSIVKDVLYYIFIQLF